MLCWNWGCRWRFRFLLLFLWQLWSLRKWPRLLIQLYRLSSECNLHSYIQRFFLVNSAMNLKFRHLVDGVKYTNIKHERKTLRVNCKFVYHSAVPLHLLPTVLPKSSCRCTVTGTWYQLWRYLWRAACVTLFTHCSLLIDIVFSRCVQNETLECNIFSTLTTTTMVNSP